MSDIDTPTNLSSARHRQPRLHSTLVSRNVVIAEHRTSVRLEPEMWDGLREICRRERMNLHQICTSVSLKKDNETSLTAAIRVYVMLYYRLAATEDGHAKAGHGCGLTLIRMNNHTPQGTEQAAFTRTSFA